MAKLSIVKIKCDREVNAYVLADTEGGEAVVIDPGAPPGKIIEQVGSRTVRWIVATHGHPGHLAGKDAVKDAAGGVTAMHMADAKAFLRSAEQYVLDGDRLDFGGFALQVIHTPGHTPGSLCFSIGNHLFTGDTLIAGGVGKEMPGSDLRQQMLSIVTKLLRLPLGTAVYPGHGPVTSLENEIRTNPYLRAAVRA